VGAEQYESWEITVDELSAFIGFVFLMGIVHPPSISDYWKKSTTMLQLLEYLETFFFYIPQYVHFADNSTLAAPGTPEYKRLGKIQPIIDSLLECFRAVCNLHRDVSVDEAMVAFKGTSTLKQYMPMKPVK